MHRFAFIVLLLVPAGAAHEATDPEGDQMPPLGHLDLVAVRGAVDGGGADGGTDQGTIRFEVEVAEAPGDHGWSFALRLHRGDWHHRIICDLPDRGCSVHNVTGGSEGQQIPATLSVAGSVVRLESDFAAWSGTPFSLTRVEAETYAWVSGGDAAVWAPRASDLMAQDVDWAFHGAGGSETSADPEPVEDAAPDVPSRRAPGVPLAWLALFFLALGRRATSRRAKGPVPRHRSRMSGRVPKSTGAKAPRQAASGLPLAVLLSVLVAGCASAPTAPVDGAPPTQPPAPVASKQAWTASGECHGMHQSPQGDAKVGIMRLARPPGFRALSVEVQWDALLSPGAQMGAFVTPENLPARPSFAWAIDVGQNPLVLALDNETWPPGRDPPDIEVTMFVEGSLAIDAVALVGSCTYQADATVMTQEGSS